MADAQWLRQVEEFQCKIAQDEADLQADYDREKAKLEQEHSLGHGKAEAIAALTNSFKEKQFRIKFKEEEGRVLFYKLGRLFENPTRSVTARTAATTTPTSATPTLPTTAAFAVPPVTEARGNVAPQVVTSPMLSPGFTSSLASVSTTGTSLQQLTAKGTDHGSALRSASPTRPKLRRTPQGMATLKKPCPNVSLPKSAASETPPLQTCYVTTDGSMSERITFQPLKVSRPKLKRTRPQPAGPGPASPQTPKRAADLQASFEPPKRHRTRIPSDASVSSAQSTQARDEIRVCTRSPKAALRMTDVAIPLQANDAIQVQANAESQNSHDPGQKIVSFDQVSQDNDFIREEPSNSNKFYIFKCEEHIIHFGENPLHGAARHLIAIHGRTRRHDRARAELGYLVSGCTRAMADDHNARVKKLFDEDKADGRRKYNQGLLPINALNWLESKRRAHGLAPWKPKKAPSSPTGLTAQSLTAKSGTNGLRCIINDPIPGRMYTGYWPADVKHYCVIPLPWRPSDAPLPGVPSIRTLGLMDDLPNCFAVDKAGDIIGWAEDYEDGGRLTRNRQVPIRFFDQVENAHTAWMSTKHMGPFDFEDPKPVVERFTEARDEYARLVQRDFTCYSDLKEREGVPAIALNRQDEVTSTTPASTDQDVVMTGMEDGAGQAAISRQHSAPRTQSVDTAGSRTGSTLTTSPAVSTAQSAQKTTGMIAGLGATGQIVTPNQHAQQTTKQQAYQPCMATRLTEARTLGEVSWAVTTCAAGNSGSSREATATTFEKPVDVSTRQQAPAPAAVGVPAPAPAQQESTMYRPPPQPGFALPPRSSSPHTPISPEPSPVWPTAPSITPQVKTKPAVVPTPNLNSGANSFSITERLPPTPIRTPSPQVSSAAGLQGGASQVDIAAVSLAAQVHSSITSAPTDVTLAAKPSENSNTQAKSRQPDCVFGLSGYSQAIDREKLEENLQVLEPQLRLEIQERGTSVAQTKSGSAVMITVDPSHNKELFFDHNSEGAGFVRVRSDAGWQLLRFGTHDGKAGKVRMREFVRWHYERNSKVQARRPA